MKTKIPLWEGNTLLQFLSGFGDFLHSLTLVNAHKGMSLPVRWIMESFCCLLWGCLCEWEAAPGNCAGEQPVGRAGRSSLLPNSPGSIHSALCRGQEVEGSTLLGRWAPSSEVCAGITCERARASPSSSCEAWGFMPLNPGTCLSLTSVYSIV